jgi:protein PhnA
MMSVNDKIDAPERLCDFCGAVNGLNRVENALGHILLCTLCMDDNNGNNDAHWRCLEGAAWSEQPAVQLAVWQALSKIDASWAREAAENIDLAPELCSGADAQSTVIHFDAHGAVLLAGDTVVLIKDLVVKGANFTAKRGTAVRGISLVVDNATHIEGRVEGQRIVILTEFVKRK